MEARVGNQRVCSETVDDYCDSTGCGSGGRLAEKTKKDIVERKMRELSSKEWKRWVPITGTFRSIKDLSNGNNLLLDEMYSKMHNTVAVLWNSSPFIAGAAYAAFYFFNR